MSKYKSTQGTTNLAFEARMILGPVGDLLRVILKANVSPYDLTQGIDNLETDLLSKDQVTIILSEDYSKFDISLLCILLLNIGIITKHLKRLRKKSSNKNIRNLRTIKNTWYSHATKHDLSDEDFEKHCIKIFENVKTLENEELGFSTYYQDAVAYLKSLAKDTGTGSEKMSILDKKRIEDLIEMIKRTEKRKLPLNVQEMYEEDILTWEKEDAYFLETHNFPKIEQQVREQPYVTFVGVSGSGKSATARHIALKLREEGYEILPIRDIKYIEIYSDRNCPQVFIMDDAFGTVGLQIIKFDKIQEFENRIKKPMMQKTKILFTSRDVVFKNEALAHTFLIEEQNVVHLHSNEYALSDQDKVDLCLKYKIDENIYSQIVFSQTSEMFPLLCKLFSEEKGLGVDVSTFFTTPISCLLELLDQMRTKNKIQYASLVFIFLNQHSLKETNLDEDNFKEIRTAVLNGCRIDSWTENYKFSEALKEMEGTFTKRCGDQFNFVHDFMIEIVGYHFGKKCPEIILQYMSSDYIAGYTKPTLLHEHEEKKVDLRIPLDESKYPMLAKRLFEDLKTGELYNVFRNKCWQHFSMRSSFIEVMKKQPFSQLYSVFLSELKESFNLRRHTNDYSLMRYKMFDVKHADSEFHRLFLSQRTLKRRRGKAVSCFYLYSVRAISWLVYVGHHETLEYIIDQIKNETGSTDILFQSSYNKGDQNYSNIKHVDIDSELKHAVDKIKFGKSKKIGDYRVPAREQHCEADDSDGELANDSENESDADIDSNQFKYGESKSNCEPLIAEQRRLLCLGCYSGDQNTVKILLHHTTLAVNNTVFRSEKHHSELEPLIIACKLGYLGIVQELLKAGIGTNLKGKNDTPLTAACAKGDLAVIKELMTASANVNLSVRNKTPLIEACAKGHLDVVEYLIENHADIDLEAGDQSPLTAACRENHIKVVKLLIKKKADINGKNKFTPLTISCYYGHVSVIKELINAKVNVNLSCEKYTPLSAACCEGNLSLVAFLIDEGANVNFRIGDKTPLTIACYKGNLEIVEKLIEKGAHIDLTDEKITALAERQAKVLQICGRIMALGDEVANVSEKRIDSPLIKACYDGKSSLIKKLIELGADVDSFGQKHTPLTAACAKNHWDVVQLLIKERANVDLSNGENTPLTIACAMNNLRFVNELIEAKANVDLADEQKGTPLTIACAKNHLSVVQMLIKANANVNLKNGRNKTPLMVSFDEGQLIVAFELILAGASVNQNFRDAIPFSVESCQRDLSLVENLIFMKIDVDLIIRKKTFLTDACTLGLFDVVEELIKANANVNLNDGKTTPLTAACSIGHMGIVKALIEAGADVDLSDNYRTPLTAACSFKQYDIVKALIKKGADVDLSDNYRTPLTVACSLGNLDIVEALIEAGADVDLTDNYRTPLTAACSLGDSDIVKALIKAHADVNLSDEYRTPLTTACYDNHFEVVVELIKAGADVNLADRKNTPLNVAYERMNMYIFDYLLRKGGEFYLSGSDEIVHRNSMVRNVLHFFEWLGERFIGFYDWVNID